MNFDRSVSAEQKKLFQEYWGIIQNIPKIREVIADINDMTFKVAEDNNPTTAASFNSYTNTINFTPQLFALQNTWQKMVNIYTIVHELCHVSQSQQGLYPHRIKASSFKERFRIGKLLEAETKLLDVQMERYLLQQPEFKNLDPSDSLQHYNTLLNHNENIQNANLAFVQAYWQNGKNCNLSMDIMPDVINFNQKYNIGSYWGALRDMYPNFEHQDPKEDIPIEDILRGYRSRMNLPEDFDMSYFLSDGNDNINVNENELNILALDGSVCNLKPEGNWEFGHITYHGKDGVQERVIHLETENITLNIYDQIILCIGAKEAAVQKRLEGVLKKEFACFIERGYRINSAIEFAKTCQDKHPMYATVEAVVKEFNGNNSDEAFTKWCCPHNVSGDFRETDEEINTTKLPEDSAKRSIFSGVRNRARKIWEHRPQY